jgi:hypothetical protein
MVMMSLEWAQLRARARRRRRRRLLLGVALVGTNSWVLGRASAMRSEARRHGHRHRPHER